MSEIRSRLRKLRLIQWALIAAISVFACVAEIAHGRGNGDWTLRHWLVTGLALWAVVGGFRVRHRLLHRSAEVLTKGASNPKALKQWEVGHVIGLALAGGVALWGLVVRMVLSATLWQASLFTRLVYFLLLLWTPRMPITTDSN